MSPVEPPWTTPRWKHRVRVALFWIGATVLVASILWMVAVGDPLHCTAC